MRKKKNNSADNLPYEKLDGIERCIDDEIPFEIPDSWAWIKMENLLQINPRNYLDDELQVGFMPMALLQDGFRNEHFYELRLWKEIKTGFTHFANNDVVAKITPCFQNRKSAVISQLPNEHGAGTTELHVLRDYTHYEIEFYIFFCHLTFFKNMSHISYFLQLV